ncbi:MAG: peptide/nickel transport system permease protein [Oceanospirillaceae bacterium]|jgi:peptide/nickel transport system permease protein
MSYFPPITQRILTGSITITLAACVSYWVLSLISPSQTADLSLGQYLNHLLHGDFGQSQFYHLPNLNIILEKLPATFELVIITSLIVALLALPLGLYTAIKPRHSLARAVMAFSLLGISLPVFLTGSLMVYLFAVELNWLPAFGRGEVVWFGSWSSGLLTVSGWQHMAMPATALSLTLLPLFLRLIRAELIQVMHSNPVRLAQAMGITPWRIWLRYGLRNATLPMITMASLQFGTLMAYTLVAETLFQWPGVGSLFMQGIIRGDGPLVAAYLVLVSIMFLLFNSLTDWAYGLFNPHLAPWRQQTQHTGPNTP